MIIPLHWSCIDKYIPMIEKFTSNLFRKRQMS